MGRGRGYPIPDGYEDGIINLSPSGIGYEYRDMLGSRGKGLRREYPYLSRPAPLPCLHMREPNSPNFFLNHSRTNYLNLTTNEDA